MALRYPTWVPGLPVQISASHSNTPQHVQGALRLERAPWALGPPSNWESEAPQRFSEGSLK